MKRTVDEQARRFSERAADYDAGERSPTYRACADLVVQRAARALERGAADTSGPAPAADSDAGSNPDRNADPEAGGVVLDIGTGTGAIAFALADRARRVVGRDVSEGMLDRAREKAADRSVWNASFGRGSFREPDYDGLVDVVVSNYALHHLDDNAKRAAVAAVAATGTDWFVLGDVMLFAGEPDEPAFDPAVDDPATVGVLADAFTDAGFAVVAVERVSDQAGVLVGRQTPNEGWPAADRGGP